MQARDWCFLAIAVAVLPYLANSMMVYSFVYLHGPLSWGLLDPPITEFQRSLVLFLQNVYDALVYAIPVGALLAWLVVGRPLQLALLVVVGYTVSFFLWGLVDQPENFSLWEIYLFSNHWPAVLLLGLSVYFFRRLFQPCGESVA